MPVFPKPRVAYTVDVAAEIARLRAHRKVRGIPRRRAGRLLIASWNIANFGAQKREDPHLDLLAEIISWFDLVAIQELREDFGDLERVLARLPGSFRYVMSDVAGNQERSVFLYRFPKVRQLEFVGEIAVPPADHRHIHLPGVSQTFKGFDRNPYLTAFRWGSTTFVVVSVHLYYGGATGAHVQRRALETYAVARWADLRRRSKHAFTREVIAIGDFNMPARAPGDPVYDALTRRGLTVPSHATRVASTISDVSEYDQIAVFPGDTRRRLTERSGVFDFDGVVFPDLWAGKPRSFKPYLRYYLSDHRPIWYELE